MIKNKNKDIASPNLEKKFISLKMMELSDYQIAPAVLMKWKKNDAKLGDSISLFLFLNITQKPKV